MISRQRASSSAPFLSALLPRSASLCLTLLIALSLPFLSGCGPKRLKADFTGFERAFADTSNHEVLLNLARLQNHDPTYFFKLGQITSSYKMQATLNGSGNYVIQGTGTAGNAIGGGSPTVGFENDPVFTFIPINDDTNAQLVLKPVPPETFYILYQQGWRVDQLMRLMIDRIEIPRPVGNGSCIIETIRNTPPPVHSKAVEPDPDSLSDYVTFLRVTAVAYELQKHGYLLLKGSNNFVPFDKNSTLDTSSAKPAAAPSAADLAKAADTHTAWEMDGQKWTLGQLVPEVKFVLNAPPPGPSSASADVTSAIKQQLLATKELAELSEGSVLDDTLKALAQGFSIEGAQTPQSGTTAGSGTQTCEPPHLLMRSILGIMTAAAQEQTEFDTLMKSTSRIPPSRWIPNDQTSPHPFAQAVPKVEQIPVLRIAWTSEDKGADPLVQVDYRGKQYYIADSRDPLVQENRYWNRDMFRLISQLQSQVTVDISKFPLPAVLQINTQ